MTTTVSVTDMSCDGCEDIVEGAVEEVSGVESASADRSAETVTIEGDPDVEAVFEAIEFAGYTPSTTDEDPTEDGEADDDEETEETDEADADDADGTETNEDDE
ncbi:MAG: heavy-metal-associated domain-containing protein [Halanaeroarchaeum sp.]